MNQIIRNCLPPGARFFLIVIAGLVLTGCSSSDSQSIAKDEPVSFPAEFTESDTKWTKAGSIPDSDLKLLAQHFKKFSSMADNPHITGEPTMYTSQKGTKRFYWGRSGAEKPEWIYIQFEGRKATFQEGTGSPLEELAT